MPFPEPEQLVDVQWRDPKRPPEVTATFCRPTISNCAMPSSPSPTWPLPQSLDGQPHDQADAPALQGAYVTENFSPCSASSRPWVATSPPTNNRPEAARVALISHAIWQREFNGDPSIVGQGVRINGRAATIIGVMPAGFAFPQQEQIWLPLFNTFRPARAQFPVAAGLASPRPPTSPSSPG